MRIEEIFYILKEKDKITKKELYRCGVDDKYIIDSEKCISCGTCAGVCPVEAPEEE